MFPFFLLYSSSPLQTPLVTHHITNTTLDIKTTMQPTASVNRSRDCSDSSNKMASRKRWLKFPSERETKRLNVFLHNVIFFFPFQISGLTFPAEDVSCHAQQRPHAAPPVSLHRRQPSTSTLTEWQADSSHKHLKRMCGIEEMWRLTFFFSFLCFWQT